MTLADKYPMLKQNRLLSLEEATATIRQGEHSLMTENDPKIEKTQDKPVEKPTSSEPEAKKADSEETPTVAEKAASAPEAEAGKAEDVKAEKPAAPADEKKSPPIESAPAGDAPTGSASAITAPTNTAPAGTPPTGSASANNTSTGTASAGSVTKNSISVDTPPPVTSTPAIKESPKPAEGKPEPVTKVDVPVPPSASPGDEKKKGDHGMIVDPGEAHVLVVEDNVPNFVLIARMLAYMGIQRCEWKTSGWQVVEFADTLPRIDLILMDIRLPYEDGFQALEKVRANPRLKDTLVIAVTAEASVEQIKRAKEAGFDGFLGKPLDPDRFPDQIKRVLSGESVWELH